MHSNLQTPHHHCMANLTTHKFNAEARKHKCHRWNRFQLEGLQLQDHETPILQSEDFRRKGLRIRSLGRTTKRANRK